MIKKQTELFGLAYDKYDIIDHSKDSPDYFQITQMPDKFTAGKNIIQLRGSVGLIEGTEIRIDIADAANNPVYYEAQEYLGDDGSILISVYIYPDASPGDGYICIAGDGTAGKVKWSRNITIAPNQRNSSEIIFLSGSTPQVSIRETQKSYLNQTYTQGRIVALSGSSTIQLISPGTEKIALQSSTTVLGQTRKGSPLWGKTIVPNPLIVRNQSIAHSTDLVTLQPAAQPTIEVATGDFRFSSSMAGGTIEINSPIIDTTDGIITGSFTYKSTITKILNHTQARVTNPVNFTYNNASIYNILPSAFTCSFIAEPSLISTQNTQSFVDIRLENLQPATGDIYKVRSYIKPVGSIGEYELINETVLDKQDVFIYTSSANYDRKLGTFDSTSVYQTYWKYKSYSDVFQQTIYRGDGTDTGNTALSSVTASKLIDALHIRPSGSTTLSNRDHLRLQLNDSYYNSYTKDGNYVVSFDAVAYANSNMQPDVTPVETQKVPAAWIDIYMSGSAFEDPPPYSIDRIDDIGLGKYIGSIYLSNNQRVADYELDFIPNKTGNGSPIFVVRAGEWHIGNIHVYTDMRTGFSPTYQRIVTPVPTLAREAEQEFKFQYYDYRGNEADFATSVFGVKFGGSNFYLEGQDNLLTGSLFIGTAVGKGLEQSGDDGGAIRSVGYAGFPSASAGSGSGFMIWSGSALVTTNPGYYSGVGLELVNDSSSYFRYTTDPPALDIRTNTFYLGSDKAYLSGSGENIEISSSNFWVQPDGDVFAENVTIRNVAAVDSFVYKNLLIYEDDDIFEKYTYGGLTYYRLNITGSSAGVFLRFQDKVPHPIGEINMTAVQGGSGLGGAYGAWCVLEPATGDVYLKANVAITTGTKNKINVDLLNGDWASKSFTNTSASYSDLYRIDNGDRAWMVRSYTDWKIQNSSAYNSGPVYFKYGITSGGSGGPSAMTASWAENAVSASYAVSASHEIIYETSSSYAETATSASYALTASYADIAGSSDAGSAQYVHNQAAAATTWTVNHNIGKQYLAVSVYDSSNNYIVPQQITATSTTVTTITFSAPQSGNAIVTIGTDANSYVHNQASAATTWTVSHGLDKQYLAVSVYDASNNYILPQQITATDTNTTTLTFSSLQSGNAVATIGRGTTAVSKWTSGSGDMIYRVSDVQITGSLAVSSTSSAAYFSGDGSQLTNLPSSGAGGLWSGSADNPRASGNVQITGSFIVSSSISGTKALFIVSGSTVGIGGQQYNAGPLHGAPQLVLNGNNNDPVFVGYDPAWAVQFHIQNSYAGTELGSYHSTLTGNAGNNLYFTTYDIVRMNIGKYGQINMGGPMSTASASKYLPSGSGLIITGSPLAPIFRVGASEAQFSTEQDLLIVDGRGYVKSTAEYQITGSLIVSGSDTYMEINGGNAIFQSPSGSDITFKIQSLGSGDAILQLIADIGNDNESDNPRIEFVQDGGITGSAIYQTDNRLNIANSLVSDAGIDFLTGNTNGYTNATSSLFIAPSGHITAYGNYSSSVASTASFGTYLGDGSNLTGISSGGGVADEAYTWFLA